MSFFANAHINRLTAHAALNQLAASVSNVFSAVFLLQTGLSPARVFLAFVAILVSRLAFRPLILLTVPALGLRWALIVGTLLMAGQYPLLARVHSDGVPLLEYCAAAGLANAVYWTCFNALFAVVGDAERRGTQLGVRLVLSAAASVLGPMVGGFLLTLLGPWSAFGAAATIEAFAVMPLSGIGEMPIAKQAPSHAYARARTGGLLLASDGWLMTSTVWAWQFIVFDALHQHFDTYGGVLAGAALAGSLGGIVLGRLLDFGQSRQVVRIEALLFAGGLVLRAVCGSAPAAIVVAAVVAAMIGGLYVPTLWTAYYNEVKSSPCAFRYQFVAESAWDLGGCAGGLIAAVVCALGGPFQVILVLALPIVAAQAAILAESYSGSGGTGVPASTNAGVRSTG